MIEIKKHTNYEISLGGVGCGQEMTLSENNGQLPVLKIYECFDNKPSDQYKQASFTILNRLNLADIILKLQLLEKEWREFEAR